MKLSVPTAWLVTLLMLIAAGQPVRAQASDSADEGSPVALSVAPLDHVEYPLDRPPWIDDTGDTIEANDGADVLIAVTSGPAPSPAAAIEMMEVMARGAVENYVEHLTQGYSEPIDGNQIKVDMDWIRDELISRQYEGTIQTGEAVQYESACLLRIGETQQHTLDQLIQNYRLKHRLAAVGVVGFLSLLALLGGSIVFGWASSRQDRVSLDRA